MNVLLRSLTAQRLLSLLEADTRRPDPLLSTEEANSLIADLCSALQGDTAESVLSVVREANLLEGVPRPLQRGDIRARYDVIDIGFNYAAALKAAHPIPTLRTAFRQAQKTFQKSMAHPAKPQVLTPGQSAAEVQP
ncbi:hypothetical protein [Deinococcus soli (ex Cha et al. 2016)]|uniref:hypothetical protein n=1 Tax=Deinococcus soli (ex Cha et al. 2016) TaxID=1309411 RepID=UPI001665E156|nr:hypothetical protein [Deinococcus soli (ex Cha et al. 2016)]GGB69327.1 hypothetical protein GCM10008019_26890 [Deinococcus soli (ex Cha et al. 2016)]